MSGLRQLQHLTRTADMPDDTPRHTICAMDNQALSSGTHTTTEIPALLEFLRNGPEGVSRETVATQVLELVGKALDLDSNAARTYAGDAIALFKALRATPAKVAGGGLAPWQITRVKAQISGNLGRSIRMGDLARSTRLSISQFSRAFKVSFGVSPYAHVIGERIRHAKALMVATDLPLCEIALECGFADQAHFSRRFHRTVGETPHAWRRSQRAAKV